MTFQEWFYSAPHRAKYTNDHSAYLAAQEAWEAAHEACAKVCDFEVSRLSAIDEPRPALAVGICAAAIRAGGQQ